MNDEFLRERARAVRSIADKADPFTKKRLLDLAEKYDGSIGRPSLATTRLMIPPVMDKAG